MPYFGCTGRGNKGDFCVYLRRGELPWKNWENQPPANLSDVSQVSAGNQSQRLRPAGVSAAAGPGQGVHDESGMGGRERTGVYYKTIKMMSSIEQIEHFTGFGLYDSSFINVLRTLKDPTPFLRGIAAEYAPDHLEIPYEQQKRKAGKTSNNFFTLFDAAMLSFTSYTKGGLRLATFAGFFISGCSFLIAMVYLIMKLLHWQEFALGSAPILIGVFFLGGVQLFFIGLLGEYIMSMNTRIMNRPLVIEEERLNFDEKEQTAEASSSQSVHPEPIM